MHRCLYAIFFLSGASALLFETVWFRRAGITFGNSIWAGSLVLSSFMAGLALGNALAGRYGDRLAHPVRAYAKLELLIGAAGLGVVLLLGVLNETLAPLFGLVLLHPVALNAIRLGVGFLLMLLPAAAMGATLPVIVKGLLRRDANFGGVLGLLYGWNTLGAVAGALAGELLLIGQVGILGTGIAAAVGNLLAAGLALGVQRAAPFGKGPAASPTPDAAAKGRSAAGGRRILAAAFLCGGILLALEVVWFRSLLLDVLGTSLTFAVMLAVVLSGIGLGGLLASRLTRYEASVRLLPVVPLAAGVLVVVTFWALVSQTGETAREFSDDPFQTFRLALPLMFPVCLASGVLFTFLGAALHRQLGSASRSAGLLTLSNTAGSMVGALAGGFLLVPHLGVERSYFWLAALYGFAALLLVPRTLLGNRRAALLTVPLVGAYLWALAAFPAGSMRRHVVETVKRRFPIPGARVVAYREGLTETAVYLRSDLFGHPFRYKLITNGHSMAGTGVHSARYMKMFVYLPVALHPRPRKALLISYGCGVTAKALTDTAELERIDVVDISRDILELGAVVYPDPATHPLNDPRVETFVEDGRFFLQTTARRYDLITAEPPPPRAAGVVNLYTQEYFQLIHDRLAPGGMTTYWLPLHNLNQGDARAIIHAFCNTFDECSLWTASGRDLILLGVREGGTRVSAERFVRQWRDPVVGPEMKVLGLEFPEQLGACFIADGPWLRKLTAEVPPLVDDFPQRLSPRLGEPGDSRYPAMIDPAAAARRFVHSEHIRRLWPESIAGASRKFFDFRYEIHDRMSGAYQIAPDDRKGLAGLHHLLTQSPLRTAVLWMLNTQVRELQILLHSPQCARENGFCFHRRGDRAMADRDYPLAARNYLHARRLDPDRAVNYRYLDIYALCMAGRRQDAQKRAEAMARLVGPSFVQHPDWRFLKRTFPLDDPPGGAARTRLSSGPVVGNATQRR